MAREGDGFLGGNGGFEEDISPLSSLTQVVYERQKWIAEAPLRFDLYQPCSEVASSYSQCKCSKKALIVRAFVCWRRACELGRILAGAAPSPQDDSDKDRPSHPQCTTKGQYQLLCRVTVMAPQAEISIPTTTVSNTDKPYTIYNITLRLPLRSFTIQKRYSDFTSLHELLQSQAGSAPPVSLPAKSWFSRTVANPDLTEERRRGLEHYLWTINESEDSRWRNTSAWRSFLNLPGSLSSQTGTKAGALHSVLSGPGGAGAPITDATVWLDCHRDVKAQLHDARLHLTSRDQAASPQKQHEASAAAKSCLVKVGGMINALEEGLKNIQQGSHSWGSQKLGDGEVRRRKDLIATAKKEKEGLENLLNAMAKKSSLDDAVAAMQDTQKLVGTKPRTGGRVLGKETAETRELDNTGVLQLQKQKMADQDLDVEELRRIVQRQRELGAAINNELEVQNEMLRMVDEGTDRVQAKVDIAKKRIAKIS